MDVTTALNQAISAAQAGRREEAHQLLEAVLAMDERNEQAWLWLSSVVDNEEERIICLENVLTINPDNQTARDRLTALQKIRTPPTQTDALPPTERHRLVDNRAFIIITVLLALMLICTVVSIVAFVTLSG